MILLIGGEKGGSGKSCLAQNLAIYLKKHRGMDVLILDADPQGTTTDWVQERAQDDARLLAGQQHEHGSPGQARRGRR